MDAQETTGTPALPRHALFEVSWEVCNKVGGIHTVVSSKARTLVERFGDEYVAVGPWRLEDATQAAAFEPEEGFEPFAEACREQGVPVKVGRWRIPGRPRALLVDFSGLLARKDPYLAGLWERHEVDSLLGGWDYIEPVVFGWAAGQVVERWWRHFLLPHGRHAVLHVHEWMSGTALLHVREHAPPIGTVFTTHATMLGRALSSEGIAPLAALDERSPAQAARDVGITAKHSLEGVAARAADVFTTVGDLTAEEAEVFHGRPPTPILPNGLDFLVLDALAGDVPAATARRRVTDLASRFLGEDVTGHRLLATSGRYEFHNKGFDVLLEAAARMSGRPGPPCVLFLLVPAGCSVPRQEMVEGPEGPLAARRDASVVSTHRLFDPERDPIQAACTRLGLDNAPARRVKVIHVPIYLDASDGVLAMPYEAAIRAFDVTCFPSCYEPWGLTPHESLALGVPTVSTDLAGFGRWMHRADGVPPDVLSVLARDGVEDDTFVGELHEALEVHVGREGRRADRAARCRQAVEALTWQRLESRLEDAYAAARRAAQARGAAAQASWAPQGETTTPRRPAPTPRIHHFEVSGPVPPALAALEGLARNYAWTWDADARDLFAKLAPDLWERAGHNPLRLVRELARRPARILQATEQLGPRLAVLHQRLHATLTASDDAASTAAGLGPSTPIAYFCAEFGIESTLQTYTGGLGILAGDHLKSASDLALPLVAVGLFYHRGYLRQRVGPEGDQLWSPAANDPRAHALEKVADEHDRPLEVQLGMPGGQVILHVWRAMVGRIPLYLLDADLPVNRPEDRTITHFIYGGDEEMRLRQEIVLGRGGVRLLERLGIQPAVVHLNEGHAAFASLERVSQLVHQHGLSFEEAQEAVRASTVFTTHTGVPAGHDRFGESLMRRYFSNVEAWLGLPWERFFALGSAPEEPGTFMMTRLAVQLAAWINGVSRIHGDVSRRLLRGCWPGLLPEEVPIRHVTNGVHLPTWTAPEVQALLRPAGGAVRAEDFTLRGATLDPARLWTARLACRRRLLEEVRRRVRRTAAERKDAADLLERRLQGLEEGALLVGFARRFAAYKRADLLFRHPRRLREVLAREDRPVRLLFAGKAHPRDGHGQQVLKRVAQAALGGELAGRVFFLEDYDIELAQLLVQGVDVWLNTPERPLEASGTSGMKAAANGVLNHSVLDGWWAEAYDGRNGWSILGGEALVDRASVDDADAEDILRTLDQQVAPLFFDRDAAGVPQRWLERVGHALETIPERFSTRRMLGEYRDAAYVPAARAWKALAEDAWSGARERAVEAQRLRRGFEALTVLAVRPPRQPELEIGREAEFRVELDLGDLGPEDVCVELLLTGPSDDARLDDARTLAFEIEGPPVGPRLRYRLRYEVEDVGRHIWAIRVSPREPHGPSPLLADLVRWA